MSNNGIAAARHESLLKIWKQRIVECKNSGLTVAQWCKQNQIGIKTYYYWQPKVWERETKILKTAEETGAVSLPTQFAQINLPAAAPELSQADVVLHYNDWSIELRNSVSPVLLNRIMQMVMKHV